MREVRAELLAAASDSLVADDYASLERAFSDVAQAQLKPEIPTSRATDDDRGEAVTVVKRFCILHRKILRHRPSNLTIPSCAPIKKVLNYAEQRCATEPIG